MNYELLKQKMVEFFKTIPAEELVKQFEELGYKFEQPKEWMPKEGDGYYYISMYGEMATTQWEEENFDLYQYNSGNCFPTKKAAEKEANWRKKDFKIRSVIAKHKPASTIYVLCLNEKGELDGRFRYECMPKCYGFNMNALDSIKSEISVDEFKAWLDR